MAKREVSKPVRAWVSRHWFNAVAPFGKPDVEESTVYFERDDACAKAGVEIPVIIADARHYKVVPLSRTRSPRRG